MGDPQGALIVECYAVVPNVRELNRQLRRVLGNDVSMVKACKSGVCIDLGSANRVCESITIKRSIDSSLPRADVSLPLTQGPLMRLTL